MLHHPIKIFIGGSTSLITFLDTEVQPQAGRILDIGATNDEGAVFHSPSLDNLASFIAPLHFSAVTISSHHFSH